jgi:hydrogenase expression/formation protein HypE
VLLAHGGGGRLVHQLIEKLFAPAFGSAGPNARHDGAVFETAAGRLAFTTDSYVVRPLFLPGGEIGALAVNGTVNDLAMCGARVRFSVRASSWKRACQWRRCGASSSRCSGRLPRRAWSW